MRLTDKRPFLIFLSSLLFLMGMAVYYYAIYSPLLLKIKTKQQELAVAEKVTASYETDPRTPYANVHIDTNSLQNKLPVKPMAEKLMLDFEKIELLSNSMIQSITFTKENGEVLTENDESQIGTNMDSQSNGSLINGENNSGLNEMGLSEAETLPPGIKKLTAQLTVNSPGYPEMKRFIQEMEQQTRILKIEQLAFTGPEEAKEIAGPTEPITYDLTVAAYYLPSLPALLQDLPKVDRPSPAQKSSPFATVK